MAFAVPLFTVGLSSDSMQARALETILSYFTLLSLKRLDGPLRRSRQAVPGATSFDHGPPGAPTSLTAFLILLQL